MPEKQRAGKVGDFWPYFRASICRYVGAHAEEIQLHARHTGTDEGMQSMTAIMSALGLGGSPKPAGQRMTELITERLGRTVKQPAGTPDAPHAGAMIEPCKHTNFSAYSGYSALIHPSPKLNRKP